MAGLIPQSFIDDLLSRVDIVDVVQSRVKLRKTGKNYAGLCPFHQEKSPSFTVEPEKQFYYCFGCGAGGNALGFVMNYENLDFPQAIESLAHGLGLEVPREESGPARRQRERHQELFAMLQQAARYYQSQLRRHPQRGRAVEYLKRRGLSGEVARDYALGYAPPGWRNLLEALGTGERERQLLREGGLLIESEKGPGSLYDRFRDRVIYPIRDARGRVIAFGGRVLGDDKPKYLNSPETPVFHKTEELYGLYEARRKVRSPERFLIVEGYMDVIALAQSDIHHCVATLGTATSAHHLRRLFRLVPEVVFCFDGDQAGRTAAWRALQQTLPLMEDGRSARFLFLPEGEDPDSQVRRHGKEAFLEQVAKATRLADFFFDELQARADMQSLEGRALLAREAMPLIRQLPQGVYRQLMRDELARLTGVDTATLEGLETSQETSPPASGPMVPSPPPPGPAAAPMPPPPDAPSPARASSPPPRAGAKRSACMKAVNLILLKPSMVNAVEIDPDLAEVQAPDIELLLEVIELARQHPDSSTHELLARIYDTPLAPPLIQVLDREQITPSEGIEREFTDIVGHLVAVHRRRKQGAARLEEARQRLRGRRGDSSQGGGTGNPPQNH